MAARAPPESPFWSGAAPGRVVRLRDVAFRGFHGCLPEEQRLGQNFVVDLDAHVGDPTVLVAGADTDAVGRALFRILREVVEGPPRKLLESVAAATAQSVFGGTPEVSSLRLRVKKPQVPVPEPLEYLGIEVLRHRNSDYAGSDKLVMQGLLCFGRHGRGEDECTLGQKLSVDAQAWFPLAKAGASDDLGDTLNYADMARLSREAVEESANRSVDELCDDVVARIFGMSELISRVHVCITKQRTPSSTGSFSCELTKDRT